MKNSISSGSIIRDKRQLSQRTAEFKMLFLDKSSLQDLQRLQQTIAFSLSSPEIFWLHDQAYFSSLLDMDRSIIGVESQGELVGYSMIYLPGEDKENLGIDINLPRAELLKVAHLQATAVHPSCRGCGLQRQMIGAHLEVLKEMGHKHICCTVSPKNPVSLRNIMANGFAIRGLKLKYAGWCRYIMHRNLAASSSSISKQIRVDGKDLRAQKELLDSGLVGVGVDGIGDDFSLFFAEEKTASY